jgi:hypothetical protein
MYYSLDSYQLTPTSFATIKVQTGQSLTSKCNHCALPLYRARNSVVYISVTALELYISKKDKAFLIYNVALLFQLADRANRLNWLQPL